MFSLDLEGWGLTPRDSRKVQFSSLNFNRLEMAPPAVVSPPNPGFLNPGEEAGGKGPACLWGNAPIVRPGGRDLQHQLPGSLRQEDGRFKAWRVNSGSAWTAK